MTSTTPVPIEPDNRLPAVDFGQANDSSSPSAFLRIDNDETPGKWQYLGMVVEQPSVLFLARQDVRKFFRYTYKEKPKDLKTNPFSCASWDGDQAFGHGGRVPKGAPKLRQCGACPHSQYHPEDKDEWCAPTHLMFGMVVHRDSDVWMPCFFEASGSKATPTSQAYNLAERRSKTSLKRQPDGPPVRTRPIYTFCFQPRSVKLQGYNGYTVDWGQPTDVPEPDLAWIAEFLRNQGKDMWDREIARRKQDALTLGLRGSAPQGSPPGTDSGAPGASDQDVPL